MVMRLLRSKNIDVDKRNNCGITALMKAAIHNHGACVDLLLKAGKYPYKWMYPNSKLFDIHNIHIIMILIKLFTFFEWQ